MIEQTAIKALTEEWSEDGFLGKVRYLEFDETGFERLVSTLEKVSLESETQLDKRLVSLLWFIPLFLEWQKPNFEKAGKDVQQLEQASNRIIPLLYEILGVP